MEIQTQEARIVLAIKAIRMSKGISIQTAAKLYKVPRSTLTHRITSRIPQLETRLNSTKITPKEEETIVRNILKANRRGFAP